MKKTRLFSSLLLILMTIVFIAPSITFAQSNVYHVPIEKNVEKGLLAFLERAFKEAQDDNAAAIVLEIHTPGGFTDAAEDIAKLMDSTRTTTPIIAFINTKAHSAGAFLALHADEIYMMPDATIGAAGVIDSAGNAAEEKAQSAWIAQMKAAAESSGREPIFAEAMANKNIDVSKYLANKEKGYLTLSAAEARKVGYSDGTVNNMQDVLKEIELANSEVIKVEPTIAEEIARIVTNPIVVPILLSIASLGLVLELYSPGFGIPGLMGLSSLGLFFFGHTIAGFAGYETILLFLIGFALLVAELFIPGGIIGIIGGAMVIISLLFAGANFVHMAYSILIAMFIAVIGMVIIMKFFGKRLHFFNKLVLKDATTTEEGYVSNVNRIELIGKVGVAITPFRPAGVISVDNERIDAVSEGGYIDARKKIEVIKVEGSRIVVREVIERVEE